MNAETRIKITGEDVVSYNPNNACARPQPAEIEFIKDEKGYVRIELGGALKSMIGFEMNRETFIRIADFLKVP